MVGCTQLLEDAKEAYSAGMVELVPELMVPCLESGDLTGETKQEAYKLVINAYLFDYLPEEADTMMNDFLNEFPDYRAAPEDPAEFSLLLDSHLRSMGIDPDSVLVTEEVAEGVDELQPVDRLVIFRRPFEYGNSLGFQLGGNGSFCQMVERYSIGDPTQDEGSFGLAPGVQLGATMNLMLSPGIETSFGLNLSMTRFSYQATPLSFTNYIYKETQNHLQIPASVVFRLNPDADRTSIYIRAGILADYLLSAKATGTRSYTTSLKDVVVENTKITDSRARLNLYGLLGAGVRIPLESAFLFFEAKITPGIFLINREENRYENQDLIWLIYHVDSDFRMHQAGIFAGMAWNL